MDIGLVVALLAVALLLLGFAWRCGSSSGTSAVVLFRLGRVVGTRQPGLRLIIPVVDVLHRVSMRIVTMPIQSQGIITRDNVSVDVSAVAYYRVVDAVKSVVAIKNVKAAMDQDGADHVAQGGGSARAGRHYPNLTG